MELTIKSYKHLLFALALVAGIQIQTFAQGAAFTYQGRLTSAGTPANGSYDFMFTLFATNSAGAALAGPVTNAATVVSNGLFTTLVNLGTVFTGSSNWLEIAVRTNNSGGFTTLSPRNQVTPTPYAISAESVSGGLDASRLTSGVVPTNVIPGFQGPFFSAVDGGQGNVADSFYDVVGGGYGNALTPNAPASVIGGGEYNSIFGDAYSGGKSTIAGGYDNTIWFNAVASAINGGQLNQIYGDADDLGGSVVGGGLKNTISYNTPYSVIGGGTNNLIEGTAIDEGFSVIAGGENNEIYSNSQYSVVGGGAENSVGYYSPNSTIGGGYGNQVGANYATVPGGVNNLAFGYASFAAGDGAQTTQSGTFVWSDAEGGLFPATGQNQFLIRAAGGVGIGTASPQASLDVVSSNGVADPQLRLVQKNGGDYSRLRYQTGNMASWDVAVGGSDDQMNWYVPAYGNVMTLQTNGALTANSLTAGNIVSGGLTTSGLTVNNNGAIHVSGAGVSTKTAVFIHVTTTANIFGPVTVINNPLCNGNPNAILIVTPNSSYTVGVPTDPVAVIYGDGLTGNQWAIVNIDGNDMNAGAWYNVLIVLP